MRRALSRARVLTVGRFLPVGGSLRDEVQYSYLFLGTRGSRRESVQLFEMKVLCCSFWCF